MISQDGIIYDITVKYKLCQRVIMLKMTCYYHRPKVLYYNPEASSIYTNPSQQPSLLKKVPTILAVVNLLKRSAYLTKKRKQSVLRN